MTTVQKQSWCATSRNMSEFINEHYVYRAEVLNVVDGDTYDMYVDLGFNSYIKARFRLHGYDTPERRRGSELEKSTANEVTKYVQCWFNARPKIYIRSYKSDSFGRWLCDVFTEHDDLGQMLYDKGYASQWPDKWREIYDSV